MDHKTLQQYGLSDNTIAVCQRLKIEAQHLLSYVITHSVAALDDAIGMIQRAYPDILDERRR